MINFNFYSFKEKRPANGQDIVFLKVTTQYNYIGFDPIQVTCEYSWYNPVTDEQICYDDNDTTHPGNGFEIRPIVGNEFVSDVDLWCSIEQMEQTMLEYVKNCA